MGLLSLLQEECIVPNGSDSALLEKLCQNLIQFSNGVFSKVKYSNRFTFLCSLLKYFLEILS